MEDPTHFWAESESGAPYFIDYPSPNIAVNDGLATVEIGGGGLACQIGDPNGTYEVVFGFATGQPGEPNEVCLSCTQDITVLPD
jgi:hypothetical protein